MGSIAAICNGLPAANTTLEAEVLNFLEAWLKAERGETGEAIHILGIDSGPELGACLCGRVGRAAHCVAAVARSLPFR